MAADLPGKFIVPWIWVRARKFTVEIYLVSLLPPSVPKSLFFRLTSLYELQKGTTVYWFSHKQDHQLLEGGVLEPRNPEQAVRKTLGNMLQVLLTPLEQKVQIWVFSSDVCIIMHEVYDLNYFQPLNTTFLDQIPS